MKDYVPTENYKQRNKSATLSEIKKVVYDTVQREHKMRVHYSEQKEVFGTVLREDKM
jgi:hypothetical protein